MLNGLGITRGFTLSRIISGLSKTLQMANQIIPLYQKARPAIQNARNMLGILKEMNKSSDKVNQNQGNSKSQTLNSTKEKTFSDTPTFFL